MIQLNHSLERMGISELRATSILIATKSHEFHENNCFDNHVR